MDMIANPAHPTTPPAAAIHANPLLHQPPHVPAAAVAPDSPVVAVVVFVAAPVVVAPGSPAVVAAQTLLQHLPRHVPMLGGVLV